MFQRIAKRRRALMPIVCCGLPLLLALFVGGCRTAPVPIPEGLSRAQLFQRAQEAFDLERYAVANQHYHAIIERFPDDAAARVEAEYELAFILYKTERYPEALEAFQALVTRYEGARPNTLPEWPRVLALRLIETIEERMATDRRFRPRR